MSTAGGHTAGEYGVREYDVAVIGLGGLGSATANTLARRGMSVIAFEQFELGHVRGASHGDSRIIRRSYHTAQYVRLTAEAYRCWREVEAEAGRAVITTTGGLDLFPPGAAIDPADYRSALAEVGVEHEWLDGDEIRRRWPAFACGILVDGEMLAIHSPDTGIVPPARATGLLQELAVANGARLRPRTPVASLHPGGGEVVVVTTGGRRVRCGAVVVCADAWTNRLLAPLGHRVPLTVTREQVSHFPIGHREDLAIGRFPVWIWMDDPSYYGFPVYGVAEPTGAPGSTPQIKASEDCGGPVVDPDTRRFDPGPGMEQRLTGFLRQLLGSGLGPPRSSTCLYTLTTDRDFVADRLDEHPNVVVGLGAAHGFKFAAWFGEVLADLAVGGEPGVELAPFALGRRGLDGAADRSSWLV
ncbi:MAG: N-methyl-L-tryptophan oxidase [Acidimicrobiia bacterium]|nr:N-methyl-L-tryptophan oxidase [Acidimicrobiia bacterium]